MMSRRKICDAVVFHSYRQFHEDSCLELIVSTLIAATRTCSSVSHCKVIHGRVIKSVNYSCGFIGDQLVSKYLGLKCVMDAENLFDEMAHKDLVSWNSLISGFFREGYASRSLDTFSRMRCEIGMLPNEVTLVSVLSACSEIYALNKGKCVHGLALKLGLLAEVKLVNALINLYGKCGYLVASCRLFETMSLQNSVSWNSMIAMFVHNGFVKEGIECFKMMISTGIKPEEASVLTLLRASGDTGLEKLVEAVHGYLISSGLDASLAVATALLNLYSKLGKLNASRKVFRELEDPDDIAWTAMLAAYAMHGFGREAIKLFDTMVRKGIKPDRVTFTHLLSACSHSGLVMEGKNYFDIMLKSYGVEPTLAHYSCMVDLLGRSGLLTEAYELITSMPVEPNAGIWGALLGACRVYKNVELGKEVAERLIALEPSDPRNYIMVSNIYSAAGLWNDASKVRLLMKQRGLFRPPACSVIEYGNKIHRFVVGDQSHPDSEKIYSKLEEMIGKIQKAGHVSKTEFVLHDVDEDVKVDMINRHSEKLAIAFGILNINTNLPIVITKNLRICGDCHSFAKILSLTEKRTIIIRDSKRFHHFANGYCSCGDYW